MATEKAIAKKQTKAEIVSAIAEISKLTKAQVKAVDQQSLRIKGVPGRTPNDHRKSGPNKANQAEIVSIIAVALYLAWLTAAWDSFLAAVTFVFLLRALNKPLG